MKPFLLLSQLSTLQVILQAANRQIEQTWIDVEAFRVGLESRACKHVIKNVKEVANYEGRGLAKFSWKQYE
jgi:hypothetical protein